MYYIYHIPGVKIGCTTQVQYRIDKQGFSSYEILETHDCIDRASVRELELQKEYGYPVDTVPYKVSYKNRPKWTAENRAKGEEVLRKEVLQYDLEGNFVKEWKSTSEAARKVGNINNTSCIRGAIKGGKRHAYGYQWKFKTDNYLKQIPPIRERYPTLECPYCGLKGRGVGYHRYHGNNCKHKP